jgi:hypothetical protein
VRVWLEVLFALLLLVNEVSESVGVVNRSLALASAYRRFDGANGVVIQETQFVGKLCHTFPDLLGTHKVTFTEVVVQNVIMGGRSSASKV